MPIDPITRWENEGGAVLAVAVIVSRRSAAREARPAGRAAVGIRTAATPAVAFRSPSPARERQPGHPGGACCGRAEASGRAIRG
jgi:hypothetical protein